MLLKAKLMSAVISGALLVGSLYSFEAKAKILNFNGLVYENTNAFEVVIPQGYNSLRVWIDKDAEFDVAITRMAFYNERGKMTRLFDSDSEVSLADGWSEFVNHLSAEHRESVIYFDKFYPDSQQEFKDFLDFLDREAHRYIIKINKGGQNNEE